MQGKKKFELSASWILERVSEWQIYQMYLPKFSLNRKILSPFRKERVASFSVFVKGNNLYHRDWGDGQFRGDCWDLVGSLYGLNYPKAVRKVAEDFGLVDAGGVIEGAVVEYIQPEIVKKSFIIKTNRWKEWPEEHEAYLQSYSLTPSDLLFCPDTKAYPVREWALNGSRMPLREGEVCFEYNLVNERGNWRKIYRPERGKEERWMSNIPYTEMHGLKNMRGCDVGILTKSLKDGAFLAKYILPCVCVIQGEDLSAITVENMKFLKEACKTLYIALDCDGPGKKASHAITKEMGVKHVNPPDSLLEEGESDFSGMARVWGKDSVIEHFKHKKII